MTNTADILDKSITVRGYEWGVSLLRTPSWVHGATRYGITITRQPSIVISAFGYRLAFGRTSFPRQAEVQA